MSRSDGHLERGLSSALGEEVRITGRRALGGGCINQAARLDTTAGTFFSKQNADPLPGLFSKEAACLRAMRASGTSLVVPKVIAFADPEGGLPGFLITEMLEPGRRVVDFDERFGRGLAELHRATADAFGFEVDTYCGATPQPNPWTKSWIEFYRTQRLGHQLRLARERGVLGSPDAKRFARLLDRLPELLEGPEEPPALIHGDLWSGNLHVSPAGTPALIDPASYYAHREAELGMMTLMGGYSGRVYDAYDEVYPLDPGWRDRNPLYELYHLVNHANLFGGGYVSQTMSLVRRYV